MRNLHGCSTTRMARKHCPPYLDPTCCVIESALPRCVSRGWLLRRHQMTGVPPPSYLPRLSDLLTASRDKAAASAAASSAQRKAHALADACDEVRAARGAQQVEMPSVATAIAAANDAEAATHAEEERAAQAATALKASAARTAHLATKTSAGRHGRSGGRLPVIEEGGRLPVIEEGDEDLESGSRAAAARRAASDAVHKRKCSPTRGATSRTV